MPATRLVRGLSISAVTLGFLGLAFCWLPPLGIVLSAAGVLAGLVGCIVATRRRHSFQWSLGGLLLSVIALGLNFYLLPEGRHLLGMG